MTENTIYEALSEDNPHKDMNGRIYFIKDGVKYYLAAISADDVIIRDNIENPNIEFIKATKCFTCHNRKNFGGGACWSCDD